MLHVRKGKVSLDFIHGLTYPHRSNAHKIFFCAIFKVYTVGWVAIEACEGLGCHRELYATKGKLCLLKMETFSRVPKNISVVYISAFPHETIVSCYLQESVM